jgi:hypothetical protein
VEVLLRAARELDVRVLHRYIDLERRGSQTKTKRGAGRPSPPLALTRSIANEASARCSTPDHPLRDAIETFIRREDAERFIEEVRGDDPELASSLRVEERELADLSF